MARLTDSYPVAGGWCSSCKGTMGAYQLDFVPLDDVAVLPLVLLDDLLGALHLHVVGLVVHWDHKKHSHFTGEHAGAHDGSTLGT